MNVIINPSDSHGHSFWGLQAYCSHDADNAKTSERVTFTATRNMDVEPEDAWKVMTATARAQNDLKRANGIRTGQPPKDGPVLHVVLAFDKDEPHDPKTMEKAADEFLSRLGADPKRMRGKSKPKVRQFADEHQVAMWGHSDTGKPHLHISINRIHPQTGRLLPDSMDYQRAQKWALQFSKRHGTDHKTPLREENAKLREQGEYVKGPRRKSRNAFEMEKALKAVSNDNSRVQAAIDHEKAKDAVLAKRQRNMEAMHKRERTVLVDAHKERKAAIARRQQREANAEKAAVRELFRPKMRELYRQQEAERRTFDSLETNMFGRAANMVKAVKLSTQDVSEHKSRIISRTFRILTNAGERKAFFDRAQERARATLLAERRQEQDARLNTLREGYSAKQDANRDVLFKERADLLARQEADKQRMAEAWKKRQPERMAAYAKAAEFELLQKQIAERREQAKETAPPIAPDFRKADKRKVANDHVPRHGRQGDDRDDTSGDEDGSDDSGGMIKGVPDHILKAKEAYSAAQEQDNSPEPDYDRPLGHRLIISQPDSDCSEFDEGEVVFGVFLIAGCDGSEVFDLAEETFNLVSVAVEESAEGGNVLPVRHRLDAGPSTAGFQL